jgi:uncharacterized membrane protein
MVDVFTEIVINQPIEKVASYAANPDNAPEWYKNITSAEWKTLPPLSVGSKIAFKASFLWKQLSYTYEVVEYQPGKRMVMQTAEGPFPMKTTYTWTEVNPDQTKMTLRNAGEPSGFSKIFAPLMAMMMKKENKKDLQRIKSILEKEQ